MRYHDGHALFTIDAEQTVTINDVPVHSGMVEPGDRVRIGQRELIVAEAGLAPSASVGEYPSTMQMKSERTFLRC